MDRGANHSKVTYGFICLSDFTTLAGLLDIDDCLKHTINFALKKTFPKYIPILKYLFFWVFRNNYIFGSEKCILLSAPLPISYYILSGFADALWVSFYSNIIQLFLSDRIQAYFPILYFCQFSLSFLIKDGRPFDIDL